MTSLTAKFSVLCILLTLVALPVVAQNSGTITGTVVDASGAVIAGATVQAVDQAKGTVVRDSKSDSDGTFRLQPLQPGKYGIKIRANGMKEWASQVVLDPSQVLGLGELRMSVGSAAETMTVEAIQPLVETATSDHSAVIDSKQVTEISLNGRDFQSLVRTIPGVVTNDSTDFRLAFNNTDAFHVNGMRGSANNVYLDGAINTDPGANDGQYTQLSMDAVGEFKLQTSNFSAEYGRNPGVLLAVNTKSGGDKYHGTLYEFNREDGFDATPFGQDSKTELRFHQFGGNIGGPIPLPGAKHKLFFFYNYEGTRAIKPGNQPYASNAPGTYDLPDPAELTGDFTSSYRPGQLGSSPFQIGQIFVPGTITYDANGEISGGTPICGTPASPCNIIPAAQFSGQAPAIVNFVSQAYLPGFFSLASSGQPDRVRVPFHDVYRFRKNQHVIRVDFNANAKTNFFFRWVDDSQRESDQGGLFGFSDYPILPEFRKKPGSSWSWNLVNIITPTLTNEFIFSYNHLTQVVDIDDTVPTSYFDRSALGFTFQELFPLSNLRSRFPNLGPCCKGSFTGAIFPPGWHSEARTFTWTDNVTKVYGQHTIKTGIFFDYNQAGQQPAWTDAPTFDFSTGTANVNDSGNYVANMLLGNYQTVSQSNGVFFGAFRFHQVEAFGQDNWKVSRKLSLDFGLRWAYLGPTYTVQPFFQNYFDPGHYDPAQAVTLDLTPGFTFGSICSVSSGTPGCAGVANFGNPFNGIVQEGHGLPLGGANHRYNNLGPRFGFAYDPWGDGKTAVRGGFGIFFERIRQNVNSFDALGNPPLTYTPVIPGSPGATGNIDNLNPGLVSGLRFPAGLNAFDKEGQVPTTYSYSFGIQREMPWKLALDVAYVGNLGRHLQYQYNLESLPIGSVVNLNGLPGAFYSPFKGYSSINFTKYGANSSYNALQSRVSRRFAKGLFLSADYTWSKAIDLIDQDNTNLGAGNIPIADPFHPNNDYARAGFDRRHVFNLSYVYSLPDFHKTGALKYVVGGWEVSGITRFQSGTPLDVTINGNPGNFVGGGVRPINTGGPVYIRSQTQWFDPQVFIRPPDGAIGPIGRNLFTGPGINNWDISVFKNFNFTESTQLQLRLESFNTFNHTQPSSVATVLSAPNPGDHPNNIAGQVNGYRNPRNVQLGIKLYF